MIRYFKTWVSTLLLFSVHTAVNGQEYRFRVGVPLFETSRFSTDIDLQTRLQDNEKVYFCKSMATLGANYELSKHFDLGSTIRIIAEHNEYDDGKLNRTFEEEDSRLTFDLTYKTKRREIARIKNKLRYQISDFDHGVEKSYIRNKTIIDNAITKYFNPYYGIELFYRIEESQLSSFRIHIGNSSEILQKREFSSYFIIENEKSIDLAVNLNYILGFKISL